MTRFTIFVSLLAVQFTRGLSEDVIFTFHNEEVAQFTFSPTKSATKCTVQTNKGDVFNYIPSNKHIGDNDRLTSIDYGRKKTCSFTLKNIGYDDVGSWKVTIGFSTSSDVEDDTSEVYDITVFIKETRKVIPVDDIRVHAGQYASVKLSQVPEDVDQCNVTDPQGNTVNIVNDDLANVELFGGCGVRILANATSHDGRWRLNALVNQTILYQGEFHLETIEKANKNASTKTIYFARGQSGRILLGKGASFCQLIQPNGFVLPMVAGDCIYDLPVVTAQHEGTWTARYGYYGKVTTDEVLFDVMTYDTKYLNATVTQTEDGKTRLNCRFAPKRSLSYQYCNFIRPDGLIINVSPGISNDRYSSHTVGLPNSLLSSIPIECGITIDKLESTDYGAWRCTAGFGNDKAIMGSILTVAKSDQYAVNTYGEDVYVKRGNDFTIKCNASAILRYCWLQSPNGTMYSLVDKKLPQSKLTLPYAAHSLSLGECAAEIGAADVTDDGKWSCFMGVSNGTEVEATVSVTVTDSYLIATTKDIMLSKGTKPVLSCHVLPQLMDKAVGYCRWIRPDGYGIYNSRSDRYITESSTSDCKLTITGNNFQEDIGRWTCVAGLTGSSVEEAWAYIDLHYESMELGTLIAIIIGACVLLTITACAFILINIRNRRRSLPKDPPAYTPEAYLPPKSLNPKHTLQLDYKY